MTVRVSEAKGLRIVFNMVRAWCESEYRRAHESDNRDSNTPAKPRSYHSGETASPAKILLLRELQGSYERLERRFVLRHHVVRPQQPEEPDALRLRELRHRHDHPLPPRALRPGKIVNRHRPLRRRDL